MVLPVAQESSDPAGAGAPKPLRQSAEASVFAVLMQVEQEVRHAASREALWFTLVNRTRALVSYRQATLLRQMSAGDARVVAVSDVPVVERRAPQILWLEEVVKGCLPRLEGTAPLPVTGEGISADQRDGWQEWGAANALLLPLPDAAGKSYGALWLVRDAPWLPAELIILRQLADAYGHAWQAFDARSNRRLREVIFSHRRSRVIAAASAAFLLALMALPVHRTALAPAEIVAEQPVLISAPLAGTIKTFSVRPNQQVAVGDVLFTFEDAPLRAQHETALQELAVAEAEYRTARQGAFGDPRQNALVAEKEANVRLKQIGADFAAQQLARVTVTAPRAGVAVFRDVDDWLGKPVVVGERLLQIADPADIALRVDLPVGDALELEPGAAITLYLNNDPLRAIHATLERTAYQPQPTGEGILAYRLMGRFAPEESLQRIGLRGTAKIEGKRVPLFLYLFRRPLSALRRIVGF